MMCGRKPWAIRVRRGQAAQAAGPAKPDHGARRGRAQGRENALP
jgi:hypothetical protein